MPATNLRRKALRVLFLCTAFWAVSFPVMKALALAQQQIMPGAGSWFITSLCVMLRFFLAGGLLLFFVRPTLKTITGPELAQGLGLACFASAGIGLQMDGLAYVPASTSAFLTQFYCVLIPLWVAFGSRRPPAVRIVICSALVLIGMAVLVNFHLSAFRLGRGEVETLAGSVLFAAQILCLEAPRYAANRPVCITTVMLLAMGGIAAPVVLATAPGMGACVRLYDSAPLLGLLGILVLVCSLVPFLLMNRWQREVTATEAGLVYCAEPVLVSALVLFLPHWLSRWAGVDYADEHVTARLFLGGCLITVANAGLQWQGAESRQTSG